MRKVKLSQTALAIARQMIESIAALEQSAESATRLSQSMMAQASELKSKGLARLSALVGVPNALGLVEHEGALCLAFDGEEPKEASAS